MWCYLLYSLLVIILLVVSFFSIEAWPLSAYPMFAANNVSAKPTIFYIEIVLSSGEQFRWIPKRSFFRKEIDIRIKSALKKDKPKSDQLKKLVQHYYQLYCAENRKRENVVQLNLIYQELSSEDFAITNSLYKSFKIKELNSVTA